MCGNHVLQASIKRRSRRRDGVKKILNYIREWLDSSVMWGELLLGNCVLCKITHTLEPNLVRHDYNTCQKLYFRSQFCRIDTFEKNVNNVGTKLYNKLQHQLKNLKNITFQN